MKISLRQIKCGNVIKDFTAPFGRYRLIGGIIISPVALVFSVATIFALWKLWMPRDFLKFLLGVIFISFPALLVSIQAMVAPVFGRACKIILTDNNSLVVEKIILFIHFYFFAPIKDIDAIKIVIGYSPEMGESKIFHLIDKQGKQLASFNWLSLNRQSTFIDNLKSLNPTIKIKIKKVIKDINTSAHQVDAE